MEDTVQAFVGVVAGLLAGVAVIGALAMLIVVESYYLAGFSTRLYWRCKESLRQVRRSAEPEVSSGRNQQGQQLDRIAKSMGTPTRCSKD
jgi:hypothetical protein